MSRQPSQKLLLKDHACFAVFLQKRMGSRRLDDTQTLAIIGTQLAEVLILIKQAPDPCIRFGKPFQDFIKRVQIPVSVFGHRVDYFTNTAAAEVTPR